MSNRKDPPAELRLIARAYALASSTGGQVDRSIQALSTAKLATGALAVAYNAGGSSPSSGVIDGRRLIYIFEKFGFVPTTDENAFRALDGGGCWRRIPTGSGLLSVEQAVGPFVATNLPVGGPDVAIVSDTISPQAIYKNAETFRFVVNAVVGLQYPTSTGGSAEITLEYSPDNGSSWITLDTRSDGPENVADAVRQVPLLGTFTGNSTNEDDTIVRVTGRSGDQVVVASSNQTRMITQQFFQ